MGLFDWLTNKPNFATETEVRFYSEYMSNTYEVDDYKYGDTVLTKRKVGDAYQVEVREYDSGRVHVEISKSIGYGGYCKDADKWFESFNCDDVRDFYNSIVNKRMNDNIEWHRRYELSFLNAKIKRDQDAIDNAPYKDRLSKCLNEDRK